MTVSRDEEYGMTELKHLLTVASDDIPDGVDLLAGVNLTPSRRPAVRRWSLAAGVAAAAVAAAAGITVGVSGGTSADSQAAKVQLVAAVTSTAGQNYHLDMTAQATGGVKIPVSGDFAPGHRAARVTATIGGETTETIVLGDTAYQKLPNSMLTQKGPKGAAPKPEPGPLSSNDSLGTPQPQYPVGLGSNPWLKAPASTLDTTYGKQAVSFARDPQGELATIKSAKSVTDKGPVTGSGWHGERYAFTTPSVKEWFGHESTEGTVDVDSAGLVRALDITVHYPDATGDESVHYTLAFTQYGESVSVTAPKADGLYTPDSLHYKLAGTHLKPGTAAPIDIF